MVVGHVQSGKTANYIGLINKAADAGYKLIIVIAGIHNNLRNQTQKRIDEGFIGRNSSPQFTDASQLIGVAKFGSTRIPVTFTNSARDFNKQTAGQVGLGINVLSEPAVLVIKKNTSTLKNITQWLKSHSLSGAMQLVDAPMLLIDDEADNASIDISKNTEIASRINGQIRELLSLFHRSCYVGYTATPFANIFIDPETEHEMIGADLFPRDFIISLDAPSNYFGATSIFSGDPSTSVVREITDNEDLLPLRHKNHHPVEELPESLLDAIHTFVLTCAIKLVRRIDVRHNSMLVNASRFTSVQSELRNVIHLHVKTLERRIRYGLNAKGDEWIQRLESTFHEEFPGLKETWIEVKESLREAISLVEVVEVNSRSSDSLRYTEHEGSGYSVIAIGGFSLSRGLTLEGLTVSYFLRNSMMYDTLMQMGRWFGFRPDYEDLCRLWMAPEAEGWYEHITESIEELRRELRQMEKAGLTPKDFGLKVRSHPDTLIVTARNKMGSSARVKVRIGLADQLIETSKLRGGMSDIRANRALAANFVTQVRQTSIYDPHRSDGNHLWTKVPAQIVMDFVGGFQNHEASLLTSTGPVTDFIQQRINGQLAEWDVVLISKTRVDDSTRVDNLFGPDLSVNCEERTLGRKSDGRILFVSSKQRVASRGDEKIGLTIEQVRQVEQQYRDDGNKLNKNGLYNYPDSIYRNVRQRPLLMLHLIRLLDSKQRGDEHRNPDSGIAKAPDVPVIAWGISFPKQREDDTNETVEYVVNTTWWRENIELDVDEDEEDAEDDQ